MNILGAYFMKTATIKLRETPVKQLFFSYLIPSVLGMLLMSINIVIDGIFVSRGVGPHGLAGVNIAVPAFSIFLSISLWIGIGGATLYSIALGKNKLDHARAIFSQAIIGGLLLVGAILIICIWKINELALLFGANEVIMPYVLDYLSILLVFGIVFVLENMLSIFVRNDGNPNLAMAALAATAIVNIGLDYVMIFVWGWGVKGAAYATVIAAFLGFLMLISHFFRPASTLKLVYCRLQPKVISRILTIGFPSFIAEISLAIVTIGFNLAFMKRIGETGVAAYSIINYLHTLMLLVFIGVSATLQPIASFHFGAGLFQRLQACLRLSVQTALVFGCLAAVIGWVFASPLVALFGVKSGTLYQLTINGAGLFFSSYIFLGYNMVYAGYYQAVGQTKKSLIIMLFQGVAFVIPLLWILPTWWGVKGIWLAYPLSQGLTVFVVWAVNLLPQRKPVAQRN